MHRPIGFFRDSWWIYTLCVVLFYSFSFTSQSQLASKLLCSLWYFHYFLNNSIFWSRIKTAPNRALSGEDYQSLPEKELNFLIGEFEKNVTIKINNDKIVEGDQEFILALKGQNGSTIIPACKDPAATIVSNDGEVFLLLVSHIDPKSSNSPVTSDRRASWIDKRRIFIALNSFQLTTHGEETRLLRYSLSTIYAFLSLIFYSKCTLTRG